MTGTMPILRAVWGSEANDVYAAGTILHYDGATWHDTNTAGITKTGTTSCWNLVKSPTASRSASWTYPFCMRTRTIAHALKRRWTEYLGSDPSLTQVVRRVDDKIFYITESLVPADRDNRPSLLLLLGNPAPHSVAAGMCFAFEGSGREHRFWVALRHAGLLEFPSDSRTRSCALEARNRIRKQELFRLDYTSPFRISILVYFSLPSAASD